MLAIYYLYYNFARPHLGCGEVSPAQVAGISDHLWSISEMVGLFEAVEAAA